MRPDVMFVDYASVPAEPRGVGVRMFLLLEDDGRYRVADGPDLAALSERHPEFVRLLRDRIE